MVEDRNLVENRIKQYRALLCGTPDRIEERTIRAQLEADVAEIMRLDRAVAENHRNRLFHRS
jgi:hypothetical protein